MSGLEKASLLLGDELGEQFLNCYCDRLSYGESFTAAFETDDPCNAYWVAKAPVYGASFVAAFIISAVECFAGDFDPALRTGREAP